MTDLRVRRPCGKGTQDKAPADVVTGMGRGRRAGHGQVEQGVDREPALFVTCRRPAPQGHEVIRHTGAVVSRSVTGPASLTYRIGLTCIGELVVKVATPGGAELDDLYATTRTPGQPTSESAE